jgi:uncharacterized radical SAM superfamily protein
MIPIRDHRSTNLLNATSAYKNVCVLNMPKIGLNNPPMAPAILQAIAKLMGSNVRVIDINLLFHEWFELNEYKKSIFYDWCELRIAPDSESAIEIDRFIDSLDLAYIYSADVVAISVFSMHSHKFTEWFLSKLQSKITGIVVIGGAGASTEDFNSRLLDKKLINYYVDGEGEYSFRAILSNNIPYPGVNSKSQILDDFVSVPIPDYSGYELEKYLNSRVHGVTIGVEGSRGCVRNCTFCDIKSFWKKYKFKDGKSLANELIALKTQYNVKHFFFNDSLVNGSDRAFRDFIQQLAQYNNSKEFNDQIHWSGYYIVKPAITYKETDWKNLRDSGVKSLFIGIESGSERVRDHMKKKFSNADIDHAMQKIQLYGIRCTWLIIIGYPTETVQDFEETLQLFRQYQPMAIDRTIDTVALGMTLGIIEDSPLADLREELHIMSMADSDTYSGIYWQNENSDFKTRIRRRIEAEELIRELGYNSWVGDNDVVSYFEKKLEDFEQGIVTEDDFADQHG